MVNVVDAPAQIRERLASLDPELIDIYDESGEHVGHEGARDGGGHYRLLIVSPHFAGQSRVARHRMIYTALGDLLRREVHALAITAYTQEEWNQAFPGR